MRRTFSVFAAIAVAALAGVAVSAQEVRFELQPAEYAPFEGPPAEAVPPGWAPPEGLRGCEKMGTGTSPDADFPGFARVGSEPVPIFSQPLTGDAAPPASAPLEFPRAAQQKDDPAAGGLPGFGLAGPGMGGLGMAGPGMGGLGMAGFGMGGLGQGGFGPGGPGYGATWYPSRPASASGPDGELGLVRQSLSAAAPVWRDGGDLVLLSAGVRNSMFFTDAVLPDSHQPFPSELWNVNLGSIYVHKFQNGWSGALGINFGSASDKPFHSIEEMNLGCMSFLQVPVKNDRDAWRFALMYSPVGNLNFPIPGIAYLWNPSDAFHASIGLPFLVVWRPAEDLNFTFSYMPLVTVNARATYRVVAKVFIYGGFESVQEAYLLADREDEKDRFMGFEKRLVSGVRWDVWQHAAIETAAGYAFDRYYGVGQNQIGNLSDQVNIAPGAFISTNLRIRY